MALATLFFPKSTSSSATISRASCAGYKLHIQQIFEYVPATHRAQEYFRSSFKSYFRGLDAKAVGKRVELLGIFRKSRIRQYPYIVTGLLDGDYEDNAMRSIGCFACWSSPR